MLTKTYDVQVKADEEPGTFTALASVFGNVDHVGDRVMPGAFTKSLRKMRESGDPLPIVMSHEWNDPMSHVGIADPADVKQTKRGLEVKGRLDIDTNPMAAQVYRLMKRRSLKAWSFGYTVQNEKVAEDGANELHEVDLVEAGPTLKGANPEAELQSIKSLLKADPGDVEVAIEDEKAVWSAAFVNDLPDSSFLYIEPGGEKDDEGKTTPRSLRHFPVKGPDGAVDMPHLRNALSRIPQSSLPQSVKDRLTAMAQRMLDNMNASSSEPDGKDTAVEDTVVDEEPDGPSQKVQDPLKKEVNRTLVELALGHPPRQLDPEPEPEPVVVEERLGRKIIGEQLDAALADIPHSEGDASDDET